MLFFFSYNRQIQRFYALHTKSTVNKWLVKTLQPWQILDTSSLTIPSYIISYLPVFIPIHFTTHQTKLMTLHQHSWSILICQHLFLGPASQINHKYPWLMHCYLRAWLYTERNMYFSFTEEHTCCKILEKTVACTFKPCWQTS